MKKLSRALSFLSFVMAACMIGCISIQSDHQELVNKLSSIDPSTNHMACATPIIDIHTHNFNGNDIPVRNILLARSDLLPWWARGYTQETLLADAVMALTEEDLFSAVPALSIRNTFKPFSVSSHDELVPADELRQSPEYTALLKAIKYYRPNRFSTLEQPLFQSEGLQPTPAFSQEEVSSLYAIYNLFKEQTSASDQTNASSSGFSSSGVGPFISDLLMSHDDLQDQYWAENATNIQFRICHMMDMDPTYDQADGQYNLPIFESGEIPTMVRLQSNSFGDMAYFVAYNPFRDHWGTNASPGNALRIVQDAIINQKAYGVKFYPPAGYQAATNMIPAPPTNNAEALKQYYARYYVDGTEIPNAELDATISNLLCWCAQEQIPVFAHCMDSEFKAYTNYGTMATPSAWRYLLDHDSNDSNGLRNLRLCLGHAGGADYWFAPGMNGWGSDVYYLCTHYPNVYCEFGDLDEILDKDKQAQFAQTMLTLCTTNSSDTNLYAFNTKIMYGSDWYMPISSGVDRKEFLKRFQQVFLLDGLESSYRPFFLINALNYLDASNRITNEKYKIDSYVKSRLRTLVQEASNE
jgi:hypothetical protein